MKTNINRHLDQIRSANVLNKQAVIALVAQLATERDEALKHHVMLVRAFEGILTATTIEQARAIAVQAIEAVVLS